MGDFRPSGDHFSSSNNFRDASLPTVYRRPVKDIERAGNQAAVLTKQLLSFSKKKSTQFASFTLNQVIEDRKAMLQRLAGDRIKVHTQLTTDSTRVHADEAEIEQAIVNLTLNARDAILQDGTLTLKTSSVELDAEQIPQRCVPGNFVQLSVSDDGCGMRPETVDRVFEPFFSTKASGKGTGLGLSTAFANIANFGGFISVHSELTPRQRVLHSLASGIVARRSRTS